MVCSEVVSVLVIRQVLFDRLEERVEEFLLQEIDEFRRLVKGRDPATGEPFGNNVSAIFDTFLRRNIPEDDEFLLALLDGQFYKHSPSALPDPLQPGSDLVNRWAHLTQPARGEEVIPGGTILYLAEPVKISYRAEPVRITEEIQGVFVVVHFAHSRRSEGTGLGLAIVQAIAEAHEESRSWSGRTPQPTWCGVYIYPYSSIGALPRGVV